MTSDAEERLKQRGLTILEHDFGRDDEPDIGGFVSLLPDGVGAHVTALVRPGLEADRRARFAEWLEVKIDRFFEHGPEPDGWQSRTSDGGWQLWAREVRLPNLDD